MGRRFFPVSKELKILGEAESTGNLSATARSHNVQPNHIRYWRNEKEKLIGKKVKTVKPALCTVRIVQISWNWELNCVIGLELNEVMDLLYNHLI